MIQRSLFSAKELPASEGPWTKRKYQLEAAESVFRKFDDERKASTMVVLPTGCHAKGQPILMFDGSIKRVEDVAVGDLLMGPDSLPRRVLQLARGRDQMVDIVPVKGDSWRVNRGHIITLEPTQDGKGKILPIKDVSVEEWRSWNTTQKHLYKLFRVPVEFSPRPAKKFDPYVLGLWLGDGGKTTTTFTIHKPDRELDAPIKRFAESYGATVNRYEDDRKCGYWSVTGSQELRDDLRSMLPIGCELHIPDDYKLGSKEIRREVIAGLMDSDGSLTSGGFDFISISRRLSEDVAFVFRSLGIAAYVSECQKSCQTGARGTYWRVSISGDCFTIPTLLPRKKAKPRLQKKSVLRTGFSAVDTGTEEDFYGFTLSGDGRFLLGDFTVTHNTGKTYLAGKGIIERWLREGRGDVIWVTHLDTLVAQARLDLSEMLRIRVGREQADSSWEDERVCVASVASLYQDGRIKEIVKRGPTLYIHDEAHHVPTAGNRQVAEKLGTVAKTLFLTATPNRADGVGMHNVCESVAYEYSLPDAIADGYLVPIEIATARIDGMDFAPLKRSEFTEDRIGGIIGSDNVMAGIRREVFKLSEDRQTVGFWPNVATAHLAADLFNHAETGRPGSSVAIDGTKMDKDEKRNRLKDYGDRKYQYLHNVGVVVEGWNNKAVSCVAMIAPDESFSRYMQKLGRGTRPLVNVDAFDTAEERRRAIAASSKPNMLVIDAAGNSGKHASRLVTAMDVLAGKDIDAATKERAKRITERGKVSSEDAIAQAVRELETEKRTELERIAKAEAARMEWQRMNPFSDSTEAPVYDVITVQPVTPDQKRYLKNVGYTDKDLKRIPNSRAAASQIMQLKRRNSLGLASFKTVRTLKRVGLDARQWSQATAGRVLAFMAQERQQSGRDYVVRPPDDIIRSAMTAEPGWSG